MTEVSVFVESPLVNVVNCFVNEVIADTRVHGGDSLNAHNGGAGVMRRLNNNQGNILILLQGKYFSLRTNIICLNYSIQKE